MKAKIRALALEIRSKSRQHEAKQQEKQALGREDLWDSCRGTSTSKIRKSCNLDVLCYHLRNSFWSSRRLKVHQHHLLLRLSNLGCRHLIVLVPNFRSGAPPFLQRTCCFLSGFRVGVRGLSVDCGGPWSGSEGVRESVGNGKVIYGFHDGQIRQGPH